MPERICSSCETVLDFTVVGTDDHGEAIWACASCGHVIQIGIPVQEEVITLSGDLTSVLEQLASLPD